MPVTAIIEFESEADHADALEVPNASESRGTGVKFEHVHGVYKMADGYFKVRQQDGTTNRVGTRDEASLISCF
jgi:hypothetical protein